MFAIKADQPTLPGATGYKDASHLPFARHPVSSAPVPPHGSQEFDLTVIGSVLLMPLEYL